MRGQESTVADVILGAAPVIEPHEGSGDEVALIAGGENRE